MLRSVETDSPLVLAMVMELLYIKTITTGWIEKACQCDSTNCLPSGHLSQLASAALFGTRLKLFISHKVFS